MVIKWQVFALLTNYTHRCHIPNGCPWREKRWSLWPQKVEWKSHPRVRPLSFMLFPTHSPNTILIIDAYHPNRNSYLNNSNAHAIKTIPDRVRIGNNAIQL